MKRINQVCCVPVINQHKGFSIIEVLIFIVLASTVLITMTMITMVSIRNSLLSQNKTLSTRYVQQAQEWLRCQLDIDWNTFVSTITEGSTYCINTIPDDVSNLDSDMSSCGYALSSQFKRSLTIVSINEENTEVAYKVLIYLRDGPTINSAQASGMLSLLE